MANQEKREEIAVYRHKIIAPILAAMEEKADAAKIVLLVVKSVKYASCRRKFA